VPVVGQVPLAVQQDLGHQPVVAEVPGALDDVALAERVADVLAGGPVDRKTAVEDEEVDPRPPEEPPEGGKDGQGQEQFEANPAQVARGDVLDVGVAEGRAAEQLQADRPRTGGKEHRTNGNAGPEQPGEGAVPLTAFEEKAVAGVIEVKHLGVRAVALVVALVRDPNHGKGRQEEHASCNPEPVVPGRIGVQVAVRGLVEQGVVRQHQVGEDNAHSQDGPPGIQPGSEPEEQNGRRDVQDDERDVEGVGDRQS
jgi:hypothetical protein